ncbi:P-loop containing nucleoside triphosphate hydrolase protein [Xylaria sp. FL1777]|nr:P-loop containing nucleoside triphosphate hydrolase protein [Xylaria sp. FL1777]
MSDENILQAIGSLGSMIQSLREDVFAEKSKSSDDFQKALSSLVGDNIDSLREHLYHLIEAVQNSKDDNDSTELEFQVAFVSSHVENSFRSLASEITSYINQNITPDHQEAHTEFAKQVEEMRRNNREYLLALNNLNNLSVANINPKANTPNNQAAERVSQSTDDETEDIKYWKEAVEELEETVRVKDEVISKKEAQLTKQDENARLLMDRYRTLVEELATVKGSMRIMCRIRPAQDTPEEELISFTNPDNLDSGNSSVLPWTNLRVTYLNDSKRTESRDFEFQRAFGGDESNQTIFNEVKDFALSSALGNSCTVMAYGATGTGKSYTFLSSDGLVHSFIRLLFQLADEQSGQYEYEFHMSAIEIYINKVFDLLQASVNGQKIEVRLTAESTIKLSSQQEAFEVINQAIDRREAASTRQNKTSSRSHFVISVRIVRRSVADGIETTGTASFVDLGGSEAAGRNLPSGAVNAQQTLQYQQGQDINKGLLDLGKNIRSVATGGKFFASHNLTKCLQTSLTQGSRLLVIATVSPLIIDQANTLGTLRWTTEAIGAVGRPPTPRTAEGPSSRNSKIQLTSPGVAKGTPGAKRSSSAASVSSSKIATPTKGRPPSAGQEKSKQ